MHLRTRPARPRSHALDPCGPPPLWRPQRSRGPSAELLGSAGPEPWSRPAVYGPRPPKPYPRAWEKVPRKVCACQFPADALRAHQGAPETALTDQDLLENRPSLRSRWESLHADLPCARGEGQGPTAGRLTKLSRGELGFLLLSYPGATSEDFLWLLWSHPAKVHVCLPVCTPKESDQDHELVVPWRKEQRLVLPTLWLPVSQVMSSAHTMIHIHHDVTQPRDSYESLKQGGCQILDSWPPKL
ncbi:uncharacterized protein LOC124960124 [Sciurus carolinensis]|uniref:uncharacterized protein LOC124960124 n=1 Tax=Sciurus carolinensis TaxID=30640 RepID=UPI001FB31DA0|nr:uncharacterized protein LOC124960124 [Sciurus carolinensis]